jgi:hypothetical protein
MKLIMIKIGFFLFLLSFYVIFVGIAFIGAIKITDLIMKIKKK